MFQSAQYWSLILVTFFIVSCSPNNQSQDPTATRLQGKAIGTTYSIIYLDQQQVLAKDKLRREFELLIDAANQSMSTYHPDSEITRFNKNQSVEPMPASETLRKVVLEGIRLNELTSGSLDITLKPLSGLWGFGPNNIPHTIPSDEAISQIKASTGVDKLTITAETIAKSLPGLEIDLNTIGKGYLVDQTAQLLAQYNIDNYLIEIGGEMRLKGRNAKGRPWKIGVINPTVGTPKAQRAVYPGNNGVATSGDYYQYFEQDGKRYSHILNPITGRPISHNLASVTVFHPSSMTADGLATAIMVLGAEKGLKLAEEQDLAIYLIIRQGDKFITKMSKAFEPHLKAQDIEKTL